MTGHTEQHEAGERCRVCGSADLEWATTQTINSGVVQNRLNTNDVTCVFYLGCNTCSETLRTVTADDVAAMLNAAPPTPGPDSKAVDFIVNYGGKCRDCADDGPVCPSTGIGCGDRRKAVEFVLGALAYGQQHGFIAAPAQPAGGWQQEQVEAVQRSLDNACAQLAANAIRSAFFVSVSGDEKPYRYHLKLSYPTMGEMHAAEDALKALAAHPQFQPLEVRLASLVQPNPEAGAVEADRVRVAKALASHPDSTWDDYEWEDMPSYVRETFLEQADLALAALTQPTGEQPSDPVHAALYSIQHHLAVMGDTKEGREAALADAKDLVSTLTALVQP